MRIWEGFRLGKQGFGKDLGLENKDLERIQVGETRIWKGFRSAKYVGKTRIWKGFRSGK